MSEQLLTCNAGSKSLKCALYELDPLTLRHRIEVDRIHDQATLSITDAEGSHIIKGTPVTPGYDASLSYILAWLQEHSGGRLVAAGHRVVHGGRDFTGPVVVSSTVRQQLEALVPLAPLHQPHNLSLIDCLSDVLPDLLQTASFDTAFHRTQPWLAQQFALPRELTAKEGILRYGFHGLSYAYITRQLPRHIGPLTDTRVAVAHLGGGASVCAIKNGESLATTMGFTALDGLMMTTRCGTIDPGILLYLQQEKHMSPKDIEDLLYKQSGLLGVSGISSDMRDLHRDDSEPAREAVELFCYMAARELGGLIAIMGGLDTLVFTGAMGVGDAVVRAKICQYLDWMHVTLDPASNDAHRIRLSPDDADIAILALPTDEEQMIAEEALTLLSSVDKSLR